MIPPIMEERLRQMGAWLDTNGEAIYESTPWTHQNDSLTPGVWYTQHDAAVYAMTLQWPEDSVLKLGSVQAPVGASAVLLGDPSKTPLTITTSAEVTNVTLVPQTANTTANWVYVIKFSGL